MFGLAIDFIVPRIDIVQRDYSGLYLDGKWLECTTVDIRREDEPARTEFIRTLGSYETEVIHQPAVIHWTAKIHAVNDKGPSIYLEIQEPEITFWNSHDDYRFEREPYVIEEMYP